MTVRIVLVHSPPHGEVPFRNIGLAYVQGALERAGHEPSICDLSWEEDRAKTDFYEAYIRTLSERVGDMGDCPNPGLLLEVTRLDDDAEPSAMAKTILGRVDAHVDRVAAQGDVFLFSVNTLTVYFASAMAAKLRRAGKKTAAGGPNLGFAPLRRLLLLSGAFDAVVEGEGEPVVGALAEALADGRAPAVAGASYVDSSSRLVETEPGPAPAIDSVARPSFRGLNLADFVSILASRGCSRRCSFCSEPGNWQAHRVRDPLDVIDEMETAATRTGLREFHFHDDQINGSLPFLDRFCATLLERGHAFRWESFCGPQGLAPERLERMRRAGCIRLKMGVQSFSPDVLHRMRRRADPAELRAAIVDTAHAGIAMHYDLLTCFPGETEGDHQRNLEMVEGIHGEQPGVYMSPNPFYLSLGSETMRLPEQYGLTLRYFDASTLPASLAATCRRAGQFPVGFSSALPRETVIRRLSELGAILARYGKDYLYLGKDAGRPRALAT